MSRVARFQLVGWALALGVAYALYVLLAARLATQDPIGETLLGRAGSVLPLAGLVLVLRVLLIVVLPPLVVRAVVRALLDKRARSK